MSNFGTPGWLKGMSISKRLSMQSAAAIGLSLALMATVITGSLMTQDMIEQDNKISEEALSAALLEKDLASLERDLNRHAALNTKQTLEDYRSNVSDLKASIAEARSKSAEEDLPLFDTVEALAAKYVSTVEARMDNGKLEPADLSVISKVGGDLDNAIEAVRDPVIARAEALDVELTNLSWTIMYVMLGIALLVGLISGYLARAIKITIGDELNELRTALTRITQGDFAVHINNTERQDELGELSRAAASLRDTSEAKKHADDELANMVDLVGDSLRKMAAGDLTVSLPEIGAAYEELRQDFNSTVSKLHETIGSVADSASSIRSGSSEISAASDDLAKRTEQHASEIAEVANAVGHINEMLGETARYAGNAQTGASGAVKEANDGASIVRDAVDAMAKIEQSTQEISKIITVIDGIAFQTNLLALNAGVEAARAGESGAGFAVVANEVRTLAQRSAEAAEEIKALINSSTGQVEVGVDLVNKAGEALGRIGKSINDVDELVAKISERAAEQSNELTETNSSMERMDQVTQQNAAMVEESTAAASSLADEADMLSKLVTSFILVNQARAKSKPKSEPAQPSAQSSAMSAPTLVHSNHNLALAPDLEDWSEF